jgi:flagellar biosynthesis protein FliQ
MLCATIFKKSIYIKNKSLETDEVDDLLDYYLFPSTVIEKKVFLEVLQELRLLEHRVPENLLDAFRFQFVGNVINVLFGKFLFSFLLFISLLLGYIIGMFTELTSIKVLTLDVSWVPTFILFFIASLIKGIYSKVIESIKLIYYTIMYTTLMKSGEIEEDIREDLIMYLQMKTSDLDTEEIYYDD